MAGVMSTLRLDEWVGTSPGKRRNKSLQRKGLFQGPGAKESLTGVSATWLTLRVSGQLPDEAGEESWVLPATKSILNVSKKK